MTSRLFRILIWVLLGIILSVVAGETQTKFYDTSYALVIGINKYPSAKWPNLAYALIDAKGIADYLREQNFNVITLFDEQATKTAIISKMEDDLARRVKENDRILFFFAGHGYTQFLGNKDWGYIVPYDGGDSSATYISMEEIRTLAEKMGAAKHQLFIMDACYGGLLATRGVGIDTSIPNYLEEITKRKAKQIITAGGKDQAVLDSGPDGHSVFTGNLLEALKKGMADLNGDGYITFTELISYLIPKASNAYQTPAHGELPGHGLGEFVFSSAKSVKKEITKKLVPADTALRGGKKASTNGSPTISKEASTKKNGMKFVLIPAGKFVMGSPPDQPGRKDNEGQHEVNISKSFYLQTTEVTQGQWKRVMGDNPSKFKDCGDDCPVETVSWDDTRKFIQKLNELDGSVKCRLPTEAEWEYACRAGTSTIFSFGDDEGKLGEFAWYKDNSKKRTHPVAQKEPNPWGLYDMHGNVFEWVEDDWHASYKGTPTDGSAWIYEPRGSSRVMRGGSWDFDARFCQSAARNGVVPGNRDGIIGFRVARDF